MARRKKPVEKKRYENRETGSIFVPNVDAETLAPKVKSGEWIPRPDLDAEAEQIAAERSKKPKADKPDA